MAVFDLFSKREARKRKQGTADVFQYDTLPQPFRVQVIHILGDALTPWRDSDYCDPLEHAPNVWWKQLFDALTREKGVFALSTKRGNPFEQCMHYILEAETTDVLDLIELAFRFIERYVRTLDRYERKRWDLDASPDDAVAELNARFREHGIGYEFSGGEIVRVDSKYIHAEAVRPALTLLHDAGRLFAGPLQEFMQAHEHHRKGEDKDAIAWALKAFESTLKAICTAHRWPFDPHKDTAVKLIGIVFDKGLVPVYLQNHFSALRAVLESGVPTVRNKTAGHGQGPAPVDVPAHYVRYALHMTASCIVFLIECHKASK
jgi:hypothetical protein